MVRLRWLQFLYLALVVDYPASIYLDFFSCSSSVKDTAVPNKKRDFAAQVYAWVPIHSRSHQRSRILPWSSSLLSSKEDDNLLSLSNPRQYISQGMNLFRQGMIQESIRSFDRAIEMDPQIRPFCWQRGISLYYAENFQQASEQFRADVQVNPYDVEEIVWDQLSLWRQEAVKEPMTLPRPDRRPIMNLVYQLYRGEAREEDLALFAAGSTSLSDHFYADLYLALYHEARTKEISKAEYYMKQALRTEYARKFGQRDYMVSVAQIHCKLRSWV